MGFRLVPNSVTLNDLERRNRPNGCVISPNSVAFWADCVNDVMAVNCVISLNLVNTCVRTHNPIDLWRNLCTSLLYFVISAQCCRKESSRSLSHLLMSFLLYHLLLNLDDSDKIW